MKRATRVPGSAVVALLLLASCGGRTGYSALDAGGVDAGRDAAVGPDADLTRWATVTLRHEHEQFAERWDRLSLRAAVYETEYAPSEALPGTSEILDNRETPDGAPCDAFYSSGMDSPVPPLPPEPDQVDGGTFEVGGLERRWDPLVTFFDGGSYTPDERRTGDPDFLLPGWLRDHDLLVALGGSSPGPFFEAAMPVVDLPELLAPNPGSQDPLRPEPDGYFHIEWMPDPEAQVHIYLRFNLDWDESALSCWPAAGAERLRLPPEWIAELTWGSGDLMVTLRRSDVLVQESTQVTFRTRRTVQTGIWFEGY